MTNKEEKVISTDEDSVTKLKKAHKNSVAKKLTDWNRENKKMMLEKQKSFEEPEEIAQEKHTIKHEQEQQPKQMLEQLIKKEAENQPKQESMSERNNLSSYTYAGILAIVGIVGVAIYYSTTTTKTKQSKQEINPVVEKKTSESKTIEMYRMR